MININSKMNNGLEIEKRIQILENLTKNKDFGIICKLHIICKNKQFYISDEQELTAFIKRSLKISKTAKKTDTFYFAHPPNTVFAVKHVYCIIDGESKIKKRNIYFRRMKWSCCKISK